MLKATTKRLLIAQALMQETSNAQGQPHQTSIAQSLMKETFGAQVLQARDFYLFTTNINKFVLTPDKQMLV